MNSYDIRDKTVIMLNGSWCNIIQEEPYTVLVNTACEQGLGAGNCQLCSPLVCNSVTQNFLEKLSRSASQEIPRFYATRGIFTVFTEVLHWTLT